MEVPTHKEVYIISDREKACVKRYARRICKICKRKREKNSKI